MRRTFSLLTLFLIIGFLAACAPRRLDTGAEKVRIVSSTPKKCTFLGVISDTNTHGDMSLTASEQELTLDHTNFLKNSAAKLGANVVVFTKPELEEHTRQVHPKIPIYRKHTAHNINAKA